jgi:hypothetical protein
MSMLPAITETDVDVNVGVIKGVKQHAVGYGEAQGRNWLSVKGES